MALSGTFYGATVANGYRLEIDWTASQNISGNYSDVTARVYWHSLGSGYTVSSSATKSGSTTIDGNVHSFSTAGASLSGNERRLIDTYTVTVYHNADGSRSADISASYSPKVSLAVYVDTVSASGTAYLDTIPRASTASSNVSWTAGTQDLGISLNVASSSFHHSIQIFVQHTDGLYYDPIGQRDNIGSSTTWQFTQAEITQAYRNIGGYENRSAIVRVFTYDQYGSQIGSYQDKTGTVYAINTATVTLNSTNSFNIGDSIPYTLNNYTTGSSGGFTYDFVFTIGGFARTFPANTAQTGTITFVQADIDAIYAQTPNANSITGTVSVKTYYNGVSTEDGIPATDTTNITANVVGSNPTFGTGYTYADTNATVKGITTNDQYIVQNQSSLTVTLPKASQATAQHAAYMLSYAASIAGSSVTIPVPTATPTLSTATTGGLLAAGTYYVVYTWVTAKGESFSSPENSIVIPAGTSTNTITVTIPSFPSGATSANIYISTATGTETKQGSTSSTTYTQTAALVAGVAQPAMTFNIGTVNASVNTNLQVTATDSRGNITTTSISVNIVPYQPPVVNATATRLNGFDVSTTLTLSGSASAVSVSGNKNAIVSAKYQYRQKGGTYNALTSFTVTGTFPSYAVTNVTLTLDNTLAWDISFVVTDKFGSTTVVQSVSAGTPILFIDSVKKSVGVGKFPTGTGTFEIAGAVTTGGNVSVTGNVTATGTISENGSLLQDKYAPAGTIQMFGGATAPSGWLICDGLPISRTTYSRLYGIIGTRFGTGDGSTTFNLPNFAGRMPVGLYSADTTLDTLGKTGGEGTHVLTTSEMPSHTHNIIEDGGRLVGKYGGADSGSNGYQYQGSGRSTTFTADAQGGGAAHNNMPPYTVVYFIIKT